MGYILPISNFGYTAYQGRDIKVKEDHHYIEKPYKVTLNMQQSMYNQDITNQMIQLQKHIPFEKIKVTHSHEDLVIANITGKGSLFNESV